MKEELTKPIGIDTQLDNVLFGQSESEVDRVKKKIQFLSQSIDKVAMINGKKVFHPIVDGANIRFELKPISVELFRMFGDSGERTYYYPIQYAEITLKGD